MSQDFSLLRSLRFRPTEVWFGNPECVYIDALRGIAVLRKMKKVVFVLDYCYILKLLKAYSTLYFCKIHSFGEFTGGPPILGD